MFFRSAFIIFALVKVKKMALFSSGNPHYKYNRKTLKYERIDNTFTYHLLRILKIASLGIIIGTGVFTLCVFFIPSPTHNKLIEENDRINSQYQLLSKQLDDALEVLSIIQERDDNFYRVMLQADSIPQALRTGNLSNTARYDKWDNLRTGNIVKQTSQKMDQLNKMLYTQSNSFDELVNLAKEREDRLQHLPAIQPVPNKDLKRTASGYGRRIDPIYKTIRFHKGMDFSAPIGTDIFATADGVITSIGWKQGYGNCIIIDHGYEYTTLYAHIHKFKKGLRRGSKVSRGDVIASVGNTGKSTGPHLHYEVRYKGVHQNPQNYYFLDLSPEEYDEMVRISSNSSQTFD